jgi:hypothetical protein
MSVDRRGLASAYGVSVRSVLPAAPLTVGNGSLGFTVDVTGLQTWPSLYPGADSDGDEGTLLGTLSDWGWHSSPGGDGYSGAHCGQTYETRRGPVRYTDLPGGLGSLSAEEAWLRANPHRLDLLRMGFDGLSRDDAGGFDQRLDLWTGLITSSFLAGGSAVSVQTCVHPHLDVIAVKISSSLLSAGDLRVRLAFPYGSGHRGNAADWTRSSAHVSDVSLAPGRRGCVVRRSLDGTPSYVATVGLSAGGTVSVTGSHVLAVSSSRQVLEIVVALSGPDGPASRLSLSYDAIESAARSWWADFWSRGAAVDVTASDDPRAGELQRRIMLSQYLTAVNCAGTMPPQETGLLCNSWSGKSHLEMHWWHAAHFALWGRPDLLSRSLDWYSRILPAAQSLALSQGYAGARWPKQCGPLGDQTPSPIAPFLVWQQPHVIYLAELLRASGEPDSVTRYAPLVFESARFMASFADLTPDGYSLGPPLVPAQESYAADRARLANPSFELAYWSWGLRVASRWLELAGLPPEPTWDAVASAMAPLPVQDGVYAAVLNQGSPVTVRDDHPSMLYGYGVVPPTAGVDPVVMAATLRSVLADWDWGSTWGWDYPAMAMTAARLGLADLAVDALLMDVPKNQYLVNGHNWQTPALPAYLPGNGGLLAAVALMARLGAFPSGWKVYWEGLICDELY